MIGQIFALGRNAVRKMLRIMPDAPDEARSAPGLPGKPQEIDPGFNGNTPMMPRPALLIEGIYLDPAVVGTVSGRPDDGCDAGLHEVKRQDRIAHTVGPRFD